MSKQSLLVGADGVEFDSHHDDSRWKAFYEAYCVERNLVTYLKMAQKYYRAPLEETLMTPAGGGKKNVSSTTAFMI